MRTWGFLTNHALVLLCIARDPGARLRDIAVSVGITERSAFGIVSDLAETGYIIKEKGGRRNRYRVEADLPVPESADRRLAIGDLLALLGGKDARVAGGAPGCPRGWGLVWPGRCRWRRGAQAPGRKRRAGRSPGTPRPCRRRTRP